MRMKPLCYSPAKWEIILYILFLGVKAQSDTHYSSKEKLITALMNWWNVPLEWNGGME